MIVSKEHQLIYSTLLEAGGGKGAGFCPQHCALLYHHSSNGAKIAPLMDPPPVLHLMHNLVSPKKSLLLEQFGNGHPKSNHSEGKPRAMVNQIYEKHAKCHLQNFP